MLERRRFLVSALALATAAAASPALAAGPPAASSELKRVMDWIYDQLVLSDPEVLTSFGLDKGDGAWAKSKLLDRSRQGLKKGHDTIRRALRDLRAIDRSALSGQDAASWDSLVFLYDNVVGAYDRFDYGTHSWPEPYLVSQLSGIYRSMPDFLANQHMVATAADAEAYLQRLSALAAELDHETERTRDAYALGVIPPAFVLKRALSQFDAILAAPAANSVMTASLERRARAANIPGHWDARAARIVEAEVYPAMARQRAVLAERVATATDDAGVWKLPRGEEYYAYALRYGTTTSMTAEEIHTLGLEQMADLTARCDALFKAEGMTQGTVAQRIQALSKDPRFVYPNTDAGKADLIATLNRQMAEVQARLPAWFGRMPRAKAEIRRVPPEIEAGATGGYYQPPALDGSRPGAYYINLRDTAETPSWTLPTLTYHEASPGHHHQIALAQEATGIHPLRRLPTFSVYSEGWGLYAEQLADEIGMYEKDPFGRIGYLNSFMFRAARLVVDTGLHHKRWTKQQGVDYMTQSLGIAQASIVTEVERYCVWPGQATSYKVGQTRWLKLREDARARLGSRFDIRAFHDTALGNGTVPLAVLEGIIEDWVKSQL